MGLMQVANKETDYDERDIELFEIIGNAIAPVLDARMQKDRHERKRKQAEEDINKLNEELELRVLQRTTELEATNKELESFAYSVSHDLRAPLRGMDGFSQALQEDYAGKLDDEGKRYLQRIRAAAQRMGQLIDDMLKLSRTTRREMKIGKVDLSEMAENITAELQESDPGRKVESIIREGQVVRGDAQLLRVVMENLLGNAWKFTGKCPQARIEFGVQEEQGKPVFFVRDNGAGFDMAYADKLFMAFQRLHSMDAFSGTGVGLANVQRVIRRHGGRVWGESDGEGKGATFYFTL